VAENGKVFISYSRDDSSFVADLAKRMRDAGSTSGSTLSTFPWVKTGTTRSSER
jgi:hypothetical protein